MTADLTNKPNSLIVNFHCLFLNHPGYSPKTDIFSIYESIPTFRSAS